MIKCPDLNKISTIFEELKQGTGFEADQGKANVFNNPTTLTALVILTKRSEEGSACYPDVRVIV